MRAPGDYSAQFAEYLRSLGSAPVLIGALAALEYRDAPRQTTDVDFLVKEVGDLPARLEADGYEVKQMSDPGEGEPYLLFVRGNGIRVDVMAAQTEFQRSAYDRAVNGTITVEDVIVFKLLSWRSRDQDDVRSILSVGHDLDEGYIEHWAQEWGVSDRWQEARAAEV